MRVGRIISAIIITDVLASSLVNRILTVLCTVICRCGRHSCEVGKNCYSENYDKQIILHSLRASGEWWCWYLVWDVTGKLAVCCHCL